MVKKLGFCRPAANETWNTKVKSVLKESKIIYYRFTCGTIVFIERQRESQNNAFKNFMMKVNLVFNDDTTSAARSWDPGLSITNINESNDILECLGTDEYGKQESE